MVGFSSSGILMSYVLGAAGVSWFFFNCIHSNFDCPFLISSVYLRLPRRPLRPHGCFYVGRTLSLEPANRCQHDLTAWFYLPLTLFSMTSFVLSVFGKFDILSAHVVERPCMHLSLCSCVSASKASPWLCLYSLISVSCTHDPRALVVQKTFLLLRSLSLILCI